MCASNLLSPPGIVDIYDSIPSYNQQSISLQKQVAAVIKTADPKFELRFVDVQRQSGASDCGLLTFAVAFAASLCHGRDPHTIHYNQNSMRSHLHQCFEQGVLTDFPEAAKSRRLGRRRHIKIKPVPVYCSCRLPWRRLDRSAGDLFQCEMCKEWFHEQCEDIPSTAITPAYKWYCSKCITCM